MISGESRQVTWKMCYDRCDDAGLWGAWGDDAYRERAGRRLPSCVDATQSDERRRRPERPSFPVVEGTRGVQGRGLIVRTAQQQRRPNTKRRSGLWQRIWDSEHGWERPLDAPDSARPPRPQRASPPIVLGDAAEGNRSLLHTLFLATGRISSGRPWCNSRGMCWA